MDIKPYDVKVLLLKEDVSELEKLLKKRWAISVMQEHAGGSLVILSKDK